MTKLETKQSLAKTDRKFDLKFLLVGDSGAGKTHFCADRKSTRLNSSHRQ